MLSNYLFNKKSDFLIVPTAPFGLVWLSFTLKIIIGEKFWYLSEDHIKRHMRLRVMECEVFKLLSFKLFVFHQSIKHLRNNTYL